MNFGSGNVKTQLSGLGFYQNYSEGGRRQTTISLGGDNLIMEKSEGSLSTQSSLSPSSISIWDKSSNLAGGITSEYLRFCKSESMGNITNEICIYCYPNFETKTLDCR